MADEVMKTAEEPEKTQATAVEVQTADVPEKTFTQADVDKIVGERLARERAKMPNEDRLKAFSEWEKGQQTEAEKAAAREAELQLTKQAAEDSKRELAVLKAGVRAEDADYVMFKVGRMGGDFGENLKVFLTEHKRFSEPKTTSVSGVGHGPSKPEDGGVLNARDRAAMGLPLDKKE